MVSYISDSKIEEAAKRFLEEYHPDGTIPIPVEEILELRLNVSIAPIQGLTSKLSIEGSFSKDFSTLFIDQDRYLNRENRARFTIAHEIGHWCLHKDYIEALPIDSLSEWKIVHETKSRDHGRLEVQANTFAGYLLMPTEPLLKFATAQKKKLPKELSALSDQSIAPYMANVVAVEFSVSYEAAQIRLLNLIRDTGGLSSN